jgi:hypothetical protein
MPEGGQAAEVRHAVACQATIETVEVLQSLEAAEVLQVMD